MKGLTEFLSLSFQRERFVSPAKPSCGHCHASASDINGSIAEAESSQFYAGGKSDQFGAKSRPGSFGAEERCGLLEGAKMVLWNIN